MEIIRWLFGFNEQEDRESVDVGEPLREELIDVDAAALGGGDNCWKNVVVIDANRIATPLVIKCSDNLVSVLAMRDAVSKFLVFKECINLALEDVIDLCIFRQISNNCIAWYNVEQRDTFVLTCYNPNTGTFTSLTEDCSIEDMIQLLPPPQLQTLLPPRNSNNDEGSNNTSSSSKVATRIQPKRAAKNKKMY